ncbi:hypothetical protein N7466_006009 [Penicillium verhagenii]|uniref:uncharacterized protein n=1 Tax=Penicillium verhagenii TaxID=1562060 RepID=UPI0025454208|nr:uncharacterized protein N7466_006009 [Penicillium verhagenii]KAJ5930516.1 hypothetical protein N7466_006009 [Penicillium verhagenii]
MTFSPKHAHRAAPDRPSADALPIPAAAGSSARRLGLISTAIDPAAKWDKHQGSRSTPTTNSAHRASNRSRSWFPGETGKTWSPQVPPP